MRHHCAPHLNLHRSINATSAAPTLYMENNLPRTETWTHMLYRQFGDVFSRVFISFPGETFRSFSFFASNQPCTCQLEMICTDCRASCYGESSSDSLELASCWRRYYQADSLQYGLVSHLNTHYQLESIFVNETTIEEHRGCASKLYQLKSSRTVQALTTGKFLLHLALI